MFLVVDQDQRTGDSRGEKKRVFQSDLLPVVEFVRRFKVWPKRL